MIGHERLLENSMENDMFPMKLTHNEEFPPKQNHIINKTIIENKGSIDLGSILPRDNI